MNPRMTKKERALLKGAIRRVFARSDLHKSIINSTAMPEHTDPSRPRVKNWNRCNECKQPTPRSYMRLDHKNPIVPVSTNFDDLVSKIGWDAFIDLVWCEVDNLNPICDTCHDRKTKEEANERKIAKRTSKASGKGRA